MTDYAVGNHVTFAGGQGEITKIEERPNGSHLLHVYTTEGQLRKLPSGLPHIEKIDSIVDRLTAKRVDDPVHYDLRDRATRLDLAYRYDRFLSLTNNRIEIEPNLQFAHIMVNYDLPWNPIRIDQRMGRLHRYGQEHTVEIRNLFFKDTRESEILSLLLEKTDQIEADLGMRSDVMGRVLEDVDLDETIMAAIANDTPTDEVVANIEATIEERKEALETVEEQFLIRDRFDLSDEDKEILDVIERSQHGEVSEDDIEILVREFFDAFEGDIKGVRPGPARSGGDVYQLDVPNVLSGDQVKQRYPMATFTRQVAIDHDDVDFIALDHPLVQSLIDFCLDSERVKGEIAVKTTEDDTAPGIRFTYRLGYISGAGDVVTEKLVSLYVTTDGAVTTSSPEVVDTLPPSEASAIDGLDRLASMADDLHQQAEMEAWDQVESFAQEAREERERETDIKRQHAERHFKEEISRWEERLEAYQARDEQGEDMSAPIGNAKRQLDILRREQKTELERLDEEQHVTPEEPELITASFVLSAN